MTPLCQSIEVLLEDAVIIRRLHLSVDETIIGKEPYSRVQLVCNIINVEEEQRRSEYGSLGDSREYRTLIGYRAIYHDLLSSSVQERADPLQGISTDAIVLQIGLQSSVWNTIEGFAKVQDGHVCLVLLVQ